MLAVNGVFPILAGCQLCYKPQHFRRTFWSFGCKFLHFCVDYCKHLLLLLSALQCLAYLNVSPDLKKTVLPILFWWFIEGGTQSDLVVNHKQKSSFWFGNFSFQTSIGVSSEYKKSSQQIQIFTQSLISLLFQIKRFFVSSCSYQTFVGLLRYCKFV